MGKFQVIGRCAKTQTLSWEDELKLFDGVPYDIDFSREYLLKILDGETLRDMSTTDIIQAILGPPEVPALQISTAVSYPIPDSDWTRRDNEDLRKAMKKFEKDREKERKWQKKHKKISPKEASKKFEEVLKDLGVYD